MVSSAAKTCGPDQISALRQHFKARCAETQQLHQNWQIRVHWALSWLEPDSETDPVDQPDGRLLYGWIFEGGRHRFCAGRARREFTRQRRVSGQSGAARRRTPPLPSYLRQRLRGG